MALKYCYQWHKCRVYIIKDVLCAAGEGAARRASERDLPARLAAEPVKPSKSTPALHHGLHDAHDAPPHG